MEIAFSVPFKRAFKKRVEGRADLESKFWQRAEIFTQNPHEPRLRTHRLSGALREMWSFTVQHDLRVVFFFTDARQAVFVDIGRHEEVY